jgi:hypothetical protein
MRIQFALAAFAALCAPSLAIADETNPVTPTTVSTDPGDRVICRPIYYEGSIIHRSECHTVKEWDRMHYEMVQAIQDYQVRSLSSPR